MLLCPVHINTEKSFRCWIDFCSYGDYLSLVGQRLKNDVCFKPPPPIPFLIQSIFLIQFAGGWHGSMMKQALGMLIARGSNSKTKGSQLSGDVSLPYVGEHKHSRIEYIDPDNNDDTERCQKSTRTCTTVICK